MYVTIGLIDAMNPRVGYQVRIEDATGRNVLLTAIDPGTGAALLTLADALRVVSYYTEHQTW